MLLGTVILLEAKRWFVHGTADSCGRLEWSAGDASLRIYPETPAAALALEGFETWQVSRIVYRTDRFEPRQTELGSRRDARPFEHVFTRRPTLVWDPIDGCAVLRGVVMQSNAIGQPTYIAS